MPSPRLFLFGTPGAGKTALLGALAQAAPTLNAEIGDQAGALPQLQEKTYANRIPATQGLESYDLRVQPAENESDPVSKVTILDCSGQSALAMLKADEPFAKTRTMQVPILTADAVVLAVDASLSGKQLADEFGQLGRWLREFYELRGRRADVAELPVYLVLTKCDLLAKNDDTFADWLQRIEDAKRKVDEAFRAYVKDQGVGFGTVQLRIWATAIKRPALADRPAQGQAPFGVAELFRQCFQSANDFRERHHAAQGRLQNVLAGLVALIALLVLLVAFLFEFQPGGRGLTLEENALALLPRPEATAAERLQGGLKKLEEKKDKLAEIRDHADFKHLPTETREAIERHHQEIARYVELYQEGLAMLKLPHLAKNEKELRALEKTAASFAPPREWHETLLGRRADKCRKEYDALAQAARAEEAWLRGETSANYALLDQSDAFYKKLRDKKKYAAAELAAWAKLKPRFDAAISKRPSPPRHEPVPGVSRFKQESLELFASVKTARDEWRRSQDMLWDRMQFVQERIPNQSKLINDN